MKKISPADITALLKGIAERIPRENLERTIFIVCTGAWIIAMVTVTVLRFTLDTGEAIEKRIAAAATAIRTEDISSVDITRYEALLEREKYPENLVHYTGTLAHNPFSPHKERIVVEEDTGPSHLFELKSIDRVKLPLMYRGFIELPDKIIAQINWQTHTQFVNKGTRLNGYTVEDITKDVIVIREHNGKLLNFTLNKPVYGDEYEAVLYDSVTEKTYNVRESSTIDEYKVVDITPTYVIVTDNNTTVRLDR